MSINKRSKRLVAAVAATGAAGLVAATLAVSAGTSSATPITKTLNYTCPFPMIGNQNVAVTIKTDMPTSIPVGQETGRFDIVSSANAGKTATEGLNLVGAKTIEGKAEMEATVVAPDLNLPVNVPNNIPKTPIPANGNDLLLNNITGSTPSLTFTKAGHATISLGKMLLTMTPRKADGTETGLGTFESACTLVAGQNAVLHEFDITDGSGDEAGGVEAGGQEAGGAEAGGVEAGGEEAGGAEAGGVEAGGVEAGGQEAGGEEAGTPPPEPIKLAYNLKGSSFIKAPNGTVPLSGGIDVLFDLASGKHTSELTLNKTVGKFKIMGFLDTTADIAFHQVGKTTGTFDGTNLTSHSEMYVNLTSVKVWGFPIGGGADCKTVEPAKIDLKSSPFDPFKGGKLKGEYVLPKLTGCGQMNDWISMFTAGPGNTIDMDLTSK